MRVSPVLRVASSFLQQRSAMAFCFYKPALDPTKHIFMNHVPQNVYEDFYRIGEYPEVHLVGSVAPATYQPRVEAIILESFSSKYNVKVNLEEVLDLTWDQLFRHTLRSQDSYQQFVDGLFRKLATGIFVKESKWTWVKEQQIRLNTASSLVDAQQPQTIREFLEAYNAAIEQLVAFSNFGFSGNITQSETAQERHYFEELNSGASGIRDLQESRPENSGLINRLMRLLHSR